MTALESLRLVIPETGAQATESTAIPIIQEYLQSSISNCMNAATGGAAGGADGAVATNWTVAGLQARVLSWN